MIGAVDLKVDQVILRLSPNEQYPEGVAVEADDSWQLFGPEDEVISRVDRFADGLREKVLDSIDLESLGQEWHVFQYVLELDVQDEEGMAIFLRQETPKRQYMEIDGVCLIGSVRFQQGQIDIRPQRLGEAIHSFGTTELGGQKATAFITQISNHEAKMSIDVSGKMPTDWPEAVADPEGSASSEAD